jgi:hypothetical protein
MRPIKDRYRLGLTLMKRAFEEETMLCILCILTIPFHRIRQLTDR